MKARGRLRRVVVVAPRGVQLQWIAEMAERFGEEFVRVGPEGLPVDSGVDPWRVFDQVVCSLDAVKPLRRRSGWSPEQVEAHNAARFRALLDAGWDMVIIDEAHHVAGSSEDVARHQLAVELTGVAPNVLLLSATPHSGKSDGFRRFLGLLDDRFLRGQPVARSTVAPYVVRTEKRQAVDNAGRVLFQPRETSLRVAPYTGPGDGAGALRGRDRVCAERLERCQAAGAQPGRVSCLADAEARVLEYRGDPRGAREALCRPGGGRESAHPVRGSGGGLGRAHRRGAVRDARQCPWARLGDRAGRS